MPISVRLALLAALSSGVAVAQHEHQSSGMGRFPQDPSLTFSNAALSAGLLAMSNVETSSPIPGSSAAIPVDKIYGLNLGNWLLMEPWMSPNEWLAMGGEHCDDCSACRGSEWSLATYLGQQQTDFVFQKHWQTWLTDADVQEIKSFGINTVRIPLPFWIIEDLVDRPAEPYARGGLDELIRGLASLKQAGIFVILDHHALPGVSSKNQMFAGNCTQDIHFYEEDNYIRASTWAAVMTFFSHVHPAFDSVFAIEAVNEPEMNYALTPGLDKYEKAFVLTIRAVELALGVVCDPRPLIEVSLDPIASAALKAAVPIIVALAPKYGIKIPFSRTTNPFLNSGQLSVSLSGLLINRKRRCISTNFMIRDWQWSSNPANPVANPADAARGPQVYDNHLYFNFGGVAAATEDAYLSTICNLMQTETAAAVGNSPMFFGEWSIATNFPASNAFLRKWGDAQKVVYGASSGWLFWNYKVVSAIDTRTWSYRDAVLNGVLTRDAKDFFDKDVCEPYRTGRQDVRKDRQGEKRAEVMKVQREHALDASRKESMVVATPQPKVDGKMMKRVRRHRERRAMIGHGSTGRLLI